ncbi:MAG: APC family permease [Candidatus Omnitrophota bacterium]|nr:APC family permease [Candidatus Omnitrophota bacterium]
MTDRPTLGGNLKRFFIGRARNPLEANLFNKISLTAFLAWIGLGADGISSSCYGPQEAFLSLGSHSYLTLFVGLATVATIFIICASYSQIVELFPGGGGGYLVASRLISPSVGMISGCALIIDYVLTIAVSIAGGAAAVFSFLPPHMQDYKLVVSIIAVLVLLFINLRGVRESVLPLVPIFLIFLLTHVFGIIYAIIVHLPSMPALAASTVREASATSSQLGFFAMMVILMRSYAMGAGTYTGLEAVSNGIPVLHEPRVQTAKKTMTYMAFSLSFLVIGLMIGYLLYNVSFQFGKTSNAVFFESLTASWNHNSAALFVFLALASEALLLFVAAQTGFLDGPRVLANMAQDRWMPSKFSMLSDRLVIKNGILIMSIAAVAILLFTRGSLTTLVILYSINVFITFCLSQAGMVRHWWNEREASLHWFKRISVNGIGLVLTSCILVSMIIMKFHQGGWITLLITGVLVAISVIVRQHYYYTSNMLRRLGDLIAVATEAIESYDEKAAEKRIEPDLNSRTAVLFVNGFNGLGLHTLFNIIRYFGNTYKNFVFVQVGILDSSNFKNEERVRQVNTEVNTELNKYVRFINSQGYYAEAVSSVGVNIVDEAMELVPRITERFPQAIFFGGQLSFEKTMLLSRWLHNYTVFRLQKQFYDNGIPFFIIPIRV